MPWRSCAHPYVRRVGVPLDLPCGPVISLPIERLADGPLRAVIEEGAMLFLHGTLEQRVELAAGLRTLVPRVLHELPLQVRPTLTFIRARLIAALALPPPPDSRPAEADHLIRSELVRTCPIIIYEPAQRLSTGCVEYWRDLRDGTGATVIIATTN